MCCIMIYVFTAQATCCISHTHLMPQQCGIAWATHSSQHTHTCTHTHGRSLHSGQPGAKCCCCCCRRRVAYLQFAATCAVHNKLIWFAPVMNIASCLPLPSCQMRLICGTLNLRHGQVNIDQQVELAGEEGWEGRRGGDGRPSTTAVFVGRLPTLPSFSFPSLAFSPPPHLCFPSFPPQLYIYLKNHVEIFDFI